MSRSVPDFQGIFSGSTLLINFGLSSVQMERVPGGFEQPEPASWRVALAGVMFGLEEGIGLLKVHNVFVGIRRRS